MELNPQELSLIAECLQQYALVSTRNAKKAEAESRPHVQRINKRNYNKAIQLLGRVIVESEIQLTQVNSESKPKPQSNTENQKILDDGWQRSCEKAQEVQ